MRTLAALARTSSWASSTVGSRHSRDLVELHELADGADAVGDIVELLGQGVDVLAVERRDDRPVETLQDVVRVSTSP